MFDTPVYKILARNDTGQAPGHQGGIVIPGEIEHFFPDVVGTISAITPTADVPIIADLVVAGRHIATVMSRYQFQTWGGTRAPERRLTSGLGPLRNMANPGDMVLFSRDPERPERIVLNLVRKGTSDYDHIFRANNGKRWGPVRGLPEPVSNLNIRAAESEIEETSNTVFSLFDDSRSTIETPTRRKARDAAFRRTLIQAYGPMCLASGEVIDTSNGLLNLDAAHIVPVELGGTDDKRNGLLLSKDIHWAFDKGLFTINKDYSIKSF